MQKVPLQKIDSKIWPKLRDLFLKNWPTHILAYSTLDNYIRLQSKDLAPNSNIYSLDEGWQHGTFILQERAITCVYTLEETCDKLRHILMQFDWNNEIKIHPYHSKDKEIINYVYNQLHLNVSYDNETTMLWLPKGQAIQINITIPDDVYISRLKSEHSIIANDHWRHKHDGSELYLKSLIENNVSCGIFGKDNNELRAWVLRLNNGILTALQTRTEHYKKGYGSLLVKCVSKMIAEQNEDVIACVIEPPRGDLIAKNMFEKFGFKVLGPVWWAKTTGEIKQ